MYARQIWASLGGENLDAIGPQYITHDLPEKKKKKNWPSLPEASSLKRLEVNLCKQKYPYI